VAKNEDGEFELILGNSQLLSVFFIVVVLLGVFFTMGYIVGRNSAPLVGADNVVASRKEGKPIVVEPASPREPAATPAPNAPTETAAQLPPASTPTPAPPKREVKAEPTPAPKPEKKPEPVKSGPAPLIPSSGAQPVAGDIYLQLVATAKAEADVMVDVLRKKGFKAMAVQHPEKPALYRVLVGPLPDGQVNKTKADLQSAGFPGNAAIKKTF